MKKIFAFLIALIVILSLSACRITASDGENNDLDDGINNGNGNQETDEGEDGDSVLHLIQNKTANFQIVVDGSMGSAITKEVKKYVNKLLNVGITVKIADDSEEAAEDCEILVGDVKNHGDKYDFDEHTLGKEGYVTTRIDNKVIITAGNLKGLLAQFDIFAESTYAALIETNGKVFDFTENLESLKIQDNYSITSVSMNKKSIKNYGIYTVEGDVDALNAARNLQDALYTMTGYWLDISQDEAADNAIVIKYADIEKTGGQGFSVTGFESGRIEILFSHYNALSRTLEEFIGEFFENKAGAVDFESGIIFEKNTKDVFYKDCPELTDDDRENDLDALIKVHNYANEGGQNVYAEDGAKYYIGLTGNNSVNIQTNVYFGTAEFIIDDTLINADNYELHSKNIFTIVRSHSSALYTKNTDRYKIIERINNNGGIRTTDKEIPLNLGYDVMVIPYDQGVLTYKRGGTGGVTGVGAVQHEVIIVRGDNTIDESTRPLFDFDEVDEIEIYRIDDEPITVSGGKFTHYATRTDMITLNRGIGISRPNVTITGMNHEVLNQPVTGISDSDSNGARYNGGGPNYNGWILPSNCHNLLVENTKLSGRAHYRQGSYDIGGTNSNKLVYKNCSQYYMYIDDDKSKGVWNETRYYWGIMGTSYCKNIEYYSSSLSRLDAHAGVYNIVVKDCDISSISIVGGGNAIIENSTVYHTRLVSLRSDFASSWRGDIRIKNCNMFSSSNSLTIISGTVHNANYGFNTVLPSLYIENVTHNRGSSIYAFSVLSIRRGDAFNSEIVNDHVPVQKIVIKQQAQFAFTKISNYTYSNFVIYNPDGVEIDNNYVQN